MFRNFSSNVALKTIYALSSGQVRAGIAVIRVSGPNAVDALNLMTSRSKKGFTPRLMYFTSIKHPNTKELIDRGMAVWFPGPSTFTGEDSCEFHVHGGSAVVNDLLEALGTIPSFSLAEPGQFTKRAFFNGKLDLTAVEGLADLLNAETTAQRKLALRQASGDLRKLYNSWRAKIIKCVAHIEAVIDFGEEEQIEDGVLNAVDRQVNELRDEIRRHLTDSRSGELLRNGVHVAIVGRPNVGKSSLLNLLCQRPAAIVTPIPGTTRDTLEIPMNLGGYPILLTDTAGIRETEDFIEREGVKRAREKLRRADLILVVVDASKDGYRPSDVLSQIDEYLGEVPTSTIDGVCGENEVTGHKTDMENGDFLHVPEVLVLFNKIDLLLFENDKDKSRQNDEDVGPTTNVEEEENEVCLQSAWRNKKITYAKISCTTKHGIDSFLRRFVELIGQMCDKSLLADSVTFTHQRHRRHVTNALEKIDEYYQFNQTDIVLSAESLRSVLRSLGKLTGDVTTDEILDCVFRDFCIGK